MNNKTYSVLAMASRCGKLLGALFSIIGFIVIVSTIAELINLGINSVSNIFSGSSSNYEIVGKAQTAMGAIDFMRAGAIILFAFSIAAVIFNFLAKENIVGSVIDAALALVAFIMNFSMDIMSAAQSAIMSGSSSTAAAKVGVNLIVAMIFILLIAILNIRAVFPTDSIITRIKSRTSSAPKTAYAPNAYAPNMGYPQNANRAYNPNQAYPQSANQAYNPNQAYPQNANQAYNPNQAYPQSANQAYNPNQAYSQNTNQAYNPNQAYPQNPAGGYYQNNNRM